MLNLLFVIPAAALALSVLLTLAPVLETLTAINL